MTNKSSDESLNEKHTSDTTQLEKKVEAESGLGNNLNNFSEAQQNSLSSILTKNLAAQFGLGSTLSNSREAQQNSLSSILTKNLAAQFGLGSTLSNFREAQQNSLSSILTKNLAAQFGLGSTLSNFREAQQNNLSSIFTKNLAAQFGLGSTLSTFHATRQNILHQRLIDYFSAQPIIQDLESSSAQHSKNIDDVMVNPSNTTEETNSSSIIICILFSIFMSISLNPVFKKLSTDAAFDLTIAFIFEYALKPLADGVIQNDSEKDKCDTKTSTDTSNQETLNTFLSNKRVITNTLDFFELPKKKSSIIENLPPGTLLTIIPDKTIPKSWLKVKITLDQTQVEGYVLRRYTAPIR